MCQYPQTKICLIGQNVSIPPCRLLLKKFHFENCMQILFLTISFSFLEHFLSMLNLVFLLKAQI